MPANLTHQYRKAEEEYRKAQTPAEQVVCLQTMLRLIPKHKGTDHLQADLKKRLKEAKAETEAEKKSPRKGPSYRFPRQGAGQVVLVGGPNSGKSRILAELTKAAPEVADYPFTTREPAPGMMPWEDVMVQLIDTPPVTASHIEPYLVNLVRAADMVLLCMDGSSDDAAAETAEVVKQLSQRKTLLSSETGFDEEDFALVRLSTILTVTRADDSDCDTRIELFREEVSTCFTTQKVELDREESREELRNLIYESLGQIRVYTKAPGKPADYKSPFTIPVGGRVEDLAYQVHRQLAGTFKYARVWGKSAHDGQTVGRDHALCDKDLVELHG